MVSWKKVSWKKSIDIANKSRNKLIDKIYDTTINSDDKSSELIMAIEEKRSKKDYFKEHTLTSSGQEEKDISVYLESHRNELKI